jgi:hypothetical protein
MIRNELRPLRELANAAVAGTRPPMGEAYGELLLKLIAEHEALREAAEQALAWLQADQRAADEDCGAPACGYCDGVIRPRQRIIDALREALK